MLIIYKKYCIMYRWYFEFVNLFLFGEIEMEKQYAIAYDIGTTGVKTCSGSI